MSCCRRYKRWLALMWLVFAGLSFNAMAQSADSVYHRFNPGWTRYYFLNKIDDLEVIDTSTELMHRYHQGFDEFDEMQTGNLGQASFRLSPQLPQHVGYRIGLDAYKDYMYSPDNTPFYTTRRPYTQLDYLLGLRNEQQFSGIHTQNIGRQYNFNFRFQRLGSQGIFARQRADWFNLGLGQSYSTKDQRYSVQGLVYQNKATLEQNGGITLSIDSAYDEIYFDRNLVPLRLDSSTLSMRERTVFVQHGFQFGNRYDHKVDDTTNYNVVAPSLRLQHRFQFTRFRYEFHDDVIDFDEYENVFHNPDKTNDRLLYDVWRNELRAAVTDIRFQNDTTKAFKALSGSAAIAHEAWRFTRLDITPMPSDNLYYENKNNVIGKFDVRSNFSQALTALPKANVLRNLFFRANGEYDIAGYNAGDYFMSTQVGLNVGPVIPTFYYNRNSASPTRLQEFYVGNHYRWENEFDKTNTTVFGGILYVRWLKGFISYNIFNVTNPIYFSDNAKPAQLLTDVKGQSVSIAPNLTAGNFHLDSRITWQSYESNILSYPDFHTLTSLYFNGKLFKSALQMTAGVEARYNSEYDAPGFEPNTSQFYVQHETTAGDYLWFDAFVNLKIRSVRLSFLGQNLLQGTSKVNSFSAMPYPLPDRSFKLRINWLFWN